MIYFSKGGYLLVKVFCRLNEQMEENGLNIKKINEETGLSRTTISNLINQNSNGIQFETLAQLCQLLDCSPGDLLVMHDVSVEFNEYKSEGFEYSAPSDNEWGEMLLNIEASCTINFEGTIHQIDFNIEVPYRFSKDSIEITDIVPSTKYNHFINRIEIPSYIKKFIESELEFFAGKTTNSFWDGTLESYN
jgi:DNA-binding Xre family transcriptional regulator